VRFGIQMTVELKPGLLDPQGKAVEGAAPSLGWDNVQDVRIGKYITFSIEAPDQEAATNQVEQMAQRFLSNPVIERFTVLDVFSLEVAGLPEGPPR
jgi:phosphoribosylformylglycinamidine synthase subunit PurS